MKLILKKKPKKTLLLKKIHTTKKGRGDKYA